MNVFSLRFVALLALGLSTAAVAAPRKVEAFDAARWASLQTGSQRPAIVVFTTTDCVHCPAVIKALAQDRHLSRVKGQLLAVVMDVAPGESDDALLRSPHYRAVERLLAFSGQAPALRHAVNPAWRGVTPYLALLRPGDPPVWVTGPPTLEELDAWARPAAAIRSNHSTKDHP